MFRWPGSLSSEVKVQVRESTAEHTCLISGSDLDGVCVCEKERAGVRV